METADIKSLSTVLGKYIRIVREVTCKVKYISNYQLLAFESNIVSFLTMLPSLQGNKLLITFKTLFEPFDCAFSPESAPPLTQSHLLYYKTYRLQEPKKVMRDTVQNGCSRLNVLDGTRHSTRLSHLCKPLFHNAVSKS